MGFYEDDEMTPDEHREYRRQRRIRNQVLADFPRIAEPSVQAAVQDVV